MLATQLYVIVLPKSKPKRPLLTASPNVFFYYDIKNGRKEVSEEEAVEGRRKTWFMLRRRFAAGRAIRHAPRLFNVKLWGNMQVAG